jgi:hypothetical protein
LSDPAWTLVLLADRVSADGWRVLPKGQVPGEERKS